eukprot:TRINITY_DN9308_c0_g1_i1.p2 TRINITY_DN9308_c0_g1~~TRINITY_DN9308_c0_g1_i1.p2  ORF type:complete len:167 (+),score=106.79 TRINITY_DN9308_c0_g1_i1:15-515(+)
MASADLKKAFQAARTEFKELSIHELKEHEGTFLKYDTSNDGFIDLQELKYMMEKLGCPQTHLGLKAMIKEVDEDNDGKIAYREYLLIFRYAKTGKLQCEGLKAIASSIDVGKAGVGGAKGFFEAKAAAINDNVAERDRAYHEQKKKEVEEKKVAKAAFKDKAALFK